MFTQFYQGHHPESSAESRGCHCTMVHATIYTLSRCFHIIRTHKWIKLWLVSNLCSHLRSLRGDLRSINTVKWSLLATLYVVISHYPPQINPGERSSAQIICHAYAWVCRKWFRIFTYTDGKQPLQILSPHIIWYGQRRMNLHCTQRYLWRYCSSSSWPSLFWILHPGIL